MTAQIITTASTDELSAQLEALARVAARPPGDAIIQTTVQELIRAAAPTQPAALQSELAAMARLSDAALWKIADSMVGSDTIALYELLTERQRNGRLHEQGRRLLAQICQETRALMLRKAHANALLKRRGHRRPQPELL